MAGAITFNDLCEHAYNAVSGELIQTQGQMDALPRLRASALAANPLSLSSLPRVRYMEMTRADSGGQYSAMMNWSPKKSGCQESTAYGL